MKLKKTAISALLGLLYLPLGGQIVETGTDAPWLKWKSISTPSWSVIYPEGADSLAREYVLSLEGWRRMVGGSVGVLPNTSRRKPMPVLLHTQSAISNGMVTWTPRRMELYSTPESFIPEATPWMEQLTVHESRHAAQMTNGEVGGYRWLRWLSGEMFAGSFAGLYPGPAFLEGDAVTAETALSQTGRGRTADFLEYWRAWNLEGKQRSWWQWRYGLFGQYSPDYYRAGYVLIAGMRSVYDDPLFTWRYFSIIDRHFFPLHVLERTVRISSGKRFNYALRGIDKALTEEWLKESLSRAPYTISKPISEAQKSFVSYSRMTPAAGGFYALKSSLDKAPELVFFKENASADSSPDGFEEESVRPFSANVGTFCWSPATRRLYWSEIISDRRWEMLSFSEIRYLDAEGKACSLVGGRRLYNPTVNEAGDRLAVVEFLEDGGCRIVTLDARDGSELVTWKLPASFSASECVWVGDALYACVTGKEGMGIRTVPGFREVLPERKFKINRLSSDGKTILFTSDRGGSNEAYSLNPATGKVLQLTSSKVGAKGAVRYGGGLIYTSVESGGVPLKFSSGADLRKDSADWNYRHDWVWTKELSHQEEWLSQYSRDELMPLVTSIRRTRAVVGGMAEVGDFAPSGRTAAKMNSRRSRAAAFGPTTGYEDASAVVGEPKPYKKAAHLIRVHSWLPAFVDYNDIAAASFEELASNGMAGATAMFQNTLGTFSGSAGVSFFHGEGNPLAGGQLKLNYYGFYPVLNATIDVGRSFARRYWITSDDGETGSSYAPTDVPLVATTLRAYVPWNLSSGGWSRGAVASASWRITNDVTGTGIVKVHTDEGLEHMVIESMEPGVQKIRNRASISARYYSVRPAAASRIYPELGIGVEAGCRFAPGLSDISLPVTYLYGYGYLPGLFRTHGIRLSASLERQSPESVLRESVMNAVPRGYSEIDGAYAAVSAYPWRSGISADYAFPFANLGWDFLCPEIYVRNLEAALHADYTLLWGGGSHESMLSAGADLTLRLGNFLWLPYDTRIGAGWNWNAPLGKGTWNFIFEIAL